MNSIPAGNELALPFLPVRDYEVSKGFYEALGFTKLLDGEVAIFGAGTTLRSILPDGMNCNLGPAPEPKLAAFLDAIRERERMRPIQALHLTSGA